MDHPQVAFEKLNANYSAQLYAVENGLETAEIEKCEQKNYILLKWKDSLIKHNESCIKTIMNSTHILESASECSEDDPTTVRMPSMECDRVAEQITSVKEVVKRMGLRSKQALNEMKNFVVTFERQFQVNSTLSDESKKLKSELESVNSKMSELIEWSSKIEKENVELKRFVATQIIDERKPELDSFQAALNAKNQEIDGLTKNLHDVKKALDSSISIHSNASNRTSSNLYKLDDPFATSTPVANAMSRSQSKNDSHSFESMLKQENAELKRNFDEMKKDFCRKLEQCHAELNAKQDQISELTRLVQQNAQEKSISTLQRDDMSSMQFTNDSNERLKAENVELKRKLTEIENSFTRQLDALESKLTAKDIQIVELNQKLQHKTQKPASSTFVIEKNAMSCSLGKDNTDEMSRRLDNCTAQLAAKSTQINELTQKLQKFAGNSLSQNAPNAKINRSILPGENCQNKNQIKQWDSDESNITDAEILDGAKIRLLEKGARTMASLMKEKYGQLRNQRDEIEALRLQLDQCNRSRGSNDFRVIRAENPECNDCEQLKERLLKISKENKLQVEIYSQKLYLQEGQIATLMAESQQLIHKHANLMKCITLCHQELSRYIYGN